MKKCCIVGAGDCREINITKDDFSLVIAADGGLKYLKQAVVEPDVIIGDFDSLGYVPDKGNVLRLKPEKDITDMHAAVNVAVDAGCDCFYFYGACGGRIDHTFANIQLIASLADNGKKAFIFDGDTVITALHNSSIVFTSENSGFISVFSHSDTSKGVSVKGLKYELENAEMKNSFALGVSNEFIGKESSVSVENGTLIIVYTR